jgi:hypothetical protein
MSRFATPKSEDARLEAAADPSQFGDLDENDPGSVARSSSAWARRWGRTWETTWTRPWTRASGDDGADMGDFGGGDFGGSETSLTDAGSGDEG